MKAFKKVGNCGGNPLAPIYRLVDIEEHYGQHTEEDGTPYCLDCEQYIQKNCQHVYRLYKDSREKKCMECGHLTKDNG
jgi:hypothetical protein